MNRGPALTAFKGEPGIHAEIRHGHLATLSRSPGELLRAGYTPGFDIVCKLAV